ncbi:MAG: hypothetical protein WCA91_21390 [Candidatus Acidiferrales bacterium]
MISEHPTARFDCSQNQLLTSSCSRGIPEHRRQQGDLPNTYKASTRHYRGIGELCYPFHDRTALVTYCGRICIFKKKINLSTSLAGQAVGIKEVDDGIWLVSFMDYDLGYFDLETRVLEPLENPFGPKVLPM